MRNRLALILPTYAVLYALCFVAAFLLRFDFRPPQIYQHVIVLGMPVVLSELRLPPITSIWVMNATRAMTTTVWQGVISARSIPLLRCVGI